MYCALPDGHAQTGSGAKTPEDAGGQNGGETGALQELAGQLPLHKTPSEPERGTDEREHGQMIRAGEKMLRRGVADIVSGMCLGGERESQQPGGNGARQFEAVHAGGQ